MHLYICGTNPPIKDTPCRDDSVCLNGRVCGLQSSLSPDSQSRKVQAYKIISHQKLCLVVFSHDVVFLHQGLHVFVHVHPLDCLFYLLLALETAEGYIYLCYNIHQYDQDAGQDVSRV